MRPFRWPLLLLPVVLAACASAPPRAVAPLADPAVEAWLQARADALSGGEPVRIEVLDGPLVQAELGADGTLRIWRGLLLRTRDEAEITFVIAHELAHRALGHFERREAGAGWDALEAEREADRAALESLRQMGLRADAATSLLSLAAGEAHLERGADAAAPDQVGQRLEVLWEQVASVPAHPMRADDPWRALVDTRFEAWFGDDPAARDLAREGLVRDHVRRPR